MSALLTLMPRLKIAMAVNLYRNKKVSLWRAADIASLTREQFKDVLASRSIRIEIEGDEDSMALLKKDGPL
jgi:predicted HTH domain antitoxin